MTAARVHVLGNAGVDLILRVSHAPADGETLIARSAARAPGGKGLNQAVVAARAGASVRFQAPVGDDAEAASVRERLAAEPIAERILPTRRHPTDMSIVIVDDAGGNRIVSTSDCADSVTPDEAAAFAAGLRPGDILLMQGNLSHAATLAAAAMAGGRGARIVLNLAPFRWAPPIAPPACDLVVNEIEAAQASGIADPASAAQALCRAGAKRVIVTLGAAGCLLAECGTITRFPAHATRVIDTTGAGDTFCGVLAARLAAGAPYPDAITAAQMAAAITVSRPGAFEALPRLGEFDQDSNLTLIHPTLKP